MISHIDRSSITLLIHAPSIQDQPGLQVCISTQGKEHWYDVPPKKSAIGVNIGSALHSWSCGLLTPSLHRVVYPQTLSQVEERYCVAFFMHPDSEYLKGNLTRI
ncbi:hypothetical protein DSO57_1010657 [Entomophthora muscae]|uniref:Uncharacterized protein n=1 Tax=Entomophthora muscae TaxID=34485 RepID=A0ACC2RXM0_9FUNG|nr:hypothetical protein DSO57_1010657 [Entomophthora muscae]